MFANDQTNKGSETFENAITAVGYGKFNFFTIFASGGALMCVIIESMSGMFILPSAKCDLNLTLTEQGFLYSISFFGVVSSSYLWGYIADTQGRKIVIIISLIVSAVLSLICSFVTTSWLYILIRFFNGFFIGGSSAITYAYAGEFHDSKYRPKVVAWIASSVGWGTLLIPGLAWLILTQRWAYQIPLLNVVFRPWRLLVVIYALPSIFFSIMIWFLPESPKYLLMQDKQEEVLTILKKMYRFNTGNSEENFPVVEILWDEEAIDEQYKRKEGLLKTLWKQTRPLFIKQYLLKTVLISYLQFAIFFTNNGLMMWYPAILQSMSEYGKVIPLSEVTLCKAILFDNLTTADLVNAKVSRIGEICNDTIDNQIFLLPVIIGVCYICVYIPIASIVHMVGARNLLYGLLLITTIAGIAAQLLSGYTMIQIMLGIFLMTGPCVSLINSINVELYPTQIRGMALAFCLMFGRIGAMAGSNLAGPLMNQFCDYLFYIFTVIHIIVVIVILVLPKPKSRDETKVVTKSES